LACIILNSAKQDKGDLIAFSVDNVQNIFFPKAKLALPRRYFMYGFGWVKPMQGNLRLEGVLCGDICDGNEDGI